MQTTLKTTVKAVLTIACAKGYDRPKVHETWQGVWVLSYFGPTRREDLAYGTCPDDLIEKLRSLGPCED